MAGDQYRVFRSIAAAVAVPNIPDIKGREGRREGGNKVLACCKAQCIGIPSLNCRGCCILKYVWVKPPRNHYKKNFYNKQTLHTFFKIVPWVWQCYQSVYFNFEIIADKHAQMLPNVNERDPPPPEIWMLQSNEALCTLKFLFSRAKCACNTWDFSLHRNMGWGSYILMMEINGMKVHIVSQFSSHIICKR